MFEEVILNNRVGKSGVVVEIIKSLDSKPVIVFLERILILYSLSNFIFLNVHEEESVVNDTESLPSEAIALTKYSFASAYLSHVTLIKGTVSEVKPTSISSSDKIGLNNLSASGKSSSLQLESIAIPKKNSSPHDIVL